MTGTISSRATTVQKKCSDSKRTQAACVVAYCTTAWHCMATGTHAEYKSLWCGDAITTLYHVRRGPVCARRTIRLTASPASLRGFRQVSRSLYDHPGRTSDWVGRRWAVGLGGAWEGAARMFFGRHSYLASRSSALAVLASWRALRVHSALQRRRESR